MKHIKHILACALVFVLMFASVSAIVAFAETFAEGEATLSLNSAEGEAGETVYLELSLDENPGMVALTCRLKFDIAAFDIVFEYDEDEEMYVGDEGKFSSLEIGSETSTGNNFVFVRNKNTSKTGLLLTIPFVIADDAKPGIYDITLEVNDGDCGNLSEEIVHVNTISGTITVIGEDKVTYENCVDGQGNLLNPYFVNDVVWVEANGGIKMPADTQSSFLLFDNALATNRVEATFTNMSLSGSRDDRNGLVFALTDHEGDHTWANDGADVSYYWAFISGTNGIEVVEMGKYQNWKFHAYAYLPDLGIDVTKGATLAAEWDANGHIKVFVNGVLALDFVDSEGTVPSGNLYGILTRRYANRPGSPNPETYTDIVTSYIAGGALATPDNEVTVTIDPTEGGSVDGDGNYYLGQTVTLTATPNAGYNFAGWYENDKIVSSDATYTFKVTASRNLTAKFTNITYNVTVNAGANGTATGTGVYAEGTNATVTATPNVGYKFTGWYVDGNKVSTDAAYTFTVTKDITLVAEFEKVEYTVPVDAQGNKLNPYFVNGVTWVEENGALKIPDGVTNSFLLFDNPLNANRIEATFNINDSFGTDGNHRNGIVFGLEDIGKDNEFWYSQADVSYYWAFIDDWQCLTVIEMGAHDNWGENFGQWGIVDLKYTLGIDITKGVTLAAEWDDEGNIKVFINDTLAWSGKDETPLTGDLYGVLINKREDGTYNAPITSIVAGKDTATITVTGENGTVTGTGEYVIGKGATLTATANDGYKFIGWFIGDELVSEAATYIHTVEADAEIVAKFEALVYYDVTVDATEGGNATGANTVLAGNTVTVIATPSAGYHFLGWFVNGEIVSEETTYEFAPTADIALEARFEKDETPAAGLDTEIKSESGETVTGVTVTPDKESYEIGEEFTVTVEITNREYMFIGWYQDGIFRSADLTYTDTYFEGTELTAMVVKKPENNGFAYIFGYTDTEMGAEGSLLRGEAAQIIYRLFTQAGATQLGSNSFDDVDGWFQNGLLYVSGKGLWNTSTSAYPYAVVSKGEVYKVICIGYGLTTDGSLNYTEYATILKNAGYISEISADLNAAILRWEFCEIVNKITGRDQYDLVDAEGNEITAEDYGFTDLDDLDESIRKTMLIATSNFANGYVDLAGRADRDELDKVKKDEE